MRYQTAATSVLLLLSLAATAQTAILNRQRAFPRTVAAGNYSGITWLGGQRYAVVNDEAASAGFAVMTIATDSLTGDILDARLDTVLTNGLKNNDEEGICYVPQWNTVFISGEADGQVMEYDMQGQATGRRLAVPEVFATALPNFSLEALTYNRQTHRFWTTSEMTLKADGPAHSLQQRVRNRLRLQSFGDDLQPREMYWYETDTTTVKRKKGLCVLGVSGLAAMDDGRMIVLERELYFPPRKIGSYALVRLYLVDPTSHQPGDTLPKTLLTEFKTRMNLVRRNFANYEGICIGPRLADGSTLLILICDSQNQYRGLLKDWLRTVVVRGMEH